jgi:hypothetical protein
MLGVVGHVVRLLGLSLQSLRPIGCLVPTDRSCDVGGPRSLAVQLASHLPGPLFIGARRGSRSIRSRSHLMLGAQPVRERANHRGLCAIVRSIIHAPMCLPCDDGNV